VAVAAVDVQVAVAQAVAAVVLQVVAANPAVVAANNGDVGPMAAQAVVPQRPNLK
jgi:hypothetical protein